MLYDNFMRNKMSNISKPVYQEVEGYPCEFTSSGGRLKDYNIYGNSIQDGTPTPAIPVEVESVGDLVTDTEDVNYGKYKVETKVYGKNLIPCPYSDPIRTRNGITYTVNSDGTIVANGIATGGRSYFVMQDYIKLPVGTYRMCGCPSGGSTTTYSIYCDIYEGSTWKSEPYDTGNGTTINVVNNQYKLKSFTINIANGTTVNNLVFKPQLEYGTTATSYEPYREPATVTTYLDEPLRKIGDYADYIDYKNQKVVRNIKYKQFNGTETWKMMTKTEYNVFYSSALAKSSAKYIPFIAMSNRYKNASNLSSNGTNKLSLSDVIYIGDTLSSTNDFKSQLAEWNTEGNPLKVYYALQTPTEESVTFPPINALKGTNIITVNTTITPSNIKVTYKE